MSQETAKPHLKATEKYNLFFATAACMNASIGFLFFNYNLSVFNSVLPYLKKYVFPDAPTGATTFIASAPIVTAAIAALFTGYFATKLGRKWVMIISDVIAIIGVIMCLFENLAVMIVGRLLIGFNLGVTTVAVPLYFTEMPPVEYRGPLSTGPSILGSTGIVLAFSLGLLVPIEMQPGETNQVWRILQAISILMVLARSLNLLIFFRYDTPTYLVSKNKLEDARKSLAKVYKPDGVEPRLEELIRERDYINATGKVKVIEMFTKKYRKAQFMGIVMMSMQHLAGFNIIMVFSNQIFGNGISDPNNRLGNYLSIALAGACLLTAFFLVYAINRYNRKPLLVVGTFCIAIVEILFAIIGMSTSDDNLAAKIILIFWSVPFVLSLGSIINVMIPESLPEIGVSISILFNWIWGFLTTQFFPNISDAIGIPATFLILGGITLVAGFYFWWQAVETRNTDKAVILQKYSGIKPQPKQIVAEDLETRRQSSSTPLQPEAKQGGTEGDIKADTEAALPIANEPATEMVTVETKA